MSTTVELVRANERYARLRAAIEQLADKWEADRLNTLTELKRIADLRALLAAVDS